MNLSRRSLLQQTVGASALAAVASAQPNPPNILYIIQEDIGPQLGCYGEPLVKTPHLDRFASQAMRFTSAYTTAPVCSASRSALMTGCYQTKIGAHQHRTWEWHKTQLPGNTRHICEWFRDAGYFTCNLQPTDPKKQAGLHGAQGSGKVDLNFFLIPDPTRTASSTAPIGTSANRASRSSPTSPSSRPIKATAGRSRASSRNRNWSIPIN